MNEGREQEAADAPQEIASEVDPTILLYSLGLDFDIEAQLAAIHDLLKRNREGAAETAEVIKSAEDRAHRLQGDLNEWAVDDLVDQIHHSAYQATAHSMAAVGMLAPLVETVFSQCFAKIGELLYDEADPPNSHKRWTARRQKHKWDCHFFVDDHRFEKGIAKGIAQLLDALGLACRVPSDLEQTLTALFAYRNAMFHGGFEWPLHDREEFVENIVKQCPSDWFIVGTTGNDPWLICMSETFIQRVLWSIEQVLQILAWFIHENRPPEPTV